MDIFSEAGWKMPEEDKLYELSELFKAFGDYTRLRILFLLFGKESMYVSELAEELQMTVSAVSHQLKLLKQKKLIKNRREGKQISYSLADDHVRLIIEKGLEHVLE